MHETGKKRAVALFLALCMCLSCLPAAVYAQDGETQAPPPETEQTIEDASVQLGDYTPPAEEPETEAPAEAEDPTPTEAPAVQEEAPVETEPETEAAEAPEKAEAPALRDGTGPAYTDADGRRDPADQVLNVDGTDFILIGSRQQLEALDYYPSVLVGSESGSAATENARYDVTGPIWYVYQTRSSITDEWTTEATLVYPGDANLVGAYADYELYTADNGLPAQAGTHAGKKLGQDSFPFTTATTERWIYCGGNLTQYDISVTSYNYGKYSPLNNYVIFRDIYMDYDLEDPANNAGRDPWTPLMFYGLMYGVQGCELPDAPAGSAESPLQIAVRRIRASARSADYSDLGQPTIHDVVVETGSGEMDPELYTGVGFFASITSSRPSVSSGSLSHIQAEVRNLRLEGVRVTNNFNSIHIDASLVNLLTSTLGSGVGYLLDGLLAVLTGKTGGATDFQNSLNDLLNARAKDPSLLATGGFVGRVIGKVLVEKCAAEDVQVNGAGSYIGGFVGYSEGVEDYSALSDTLGGLLDVLSFVLNIVPGLGLGDLITIVGNVLPLGTLIPVDYLNPAIKDCEVVDLQGDIGPESLRWTFVDSSLGAALGTKTLNAEYNGGFIGCKIATVMIGCGVRDSAYTVYAENYGGGFAGLARDAVIQELLTDLGVNLGAMQTMLEELMDSKINLQSMQVRCYVNDSDVAVEGGNYLGGFNGAMCNAYCINNEMKAPGKTLTVEGTGECVGGFAGIATLGWGMSLGQGDQGTGTTSLLSTLKNVLGSLLSSYGTELLSLLGVGQSEILGLQFNYAQKQDTQTGEWFGGEASVSGHSYVGGLVGKSDALIMTGTTGVALSEMSFVEHGDLSIWEIYPEMPRDESYTVTFRELNGATADQTVTAADNYCVTMPTRSAVTQTDANGLVTTYEFVGWVTTPCDHTETAPYEILYAGDVIILTGDMTVNALYSRQDYGYRRITATPTDWEGAYDDYIITWGSDENMVVLTGLNDNQIYEAANSEGAKNLTQIRTSGNDLTLFTLQNSTLTRIPNNYLFIPNRVTGQEDYYWKNVGKETYPRRVLSSGSYRLGANSNRLVAGTQWTPSINANNNLILKNDLTVLTNKNEYMVYDSANGYFRMGTEAEANACELYIWGKTPLPLKYTTVLEGEELPEQNNDETPDDSGMGPYAVIHVNGLALVQGGKYVGGLVGLTGTANVGGLLNDTIGVGDFKQFRFHDIEAVGGTAYASDDTGSAGLRVKGVTSYSADDGEGCYVGGGIGMAIGGELRRISISRLNQVEGKNNVGGFAGCVGPGELLGTGGLNLQLLGLSLLKANNLLAVGQGIETSLRTVTVTGVPAGYTVEAYGENGAGENRVFAAGGFFGRSNSTGAEDCHAVRVQWVKANYTDGNAGGFLGLSQVGGLASLDDAEGTQIKGLIDAGGQNGLLNAVGYLIPEYSNVDVHFVDTGYVRAACAGGFAADFQSGTVDNSAKAESDWFAVYNVDHVTGRLYAGGFGGKLYSGALADVGGGISVLGGLDVGSIDLQHLLGLVSAYVPTVIKAGVKSCRETKDDPEDSSLPDGFLVKVEGLDADDKTTGAAGGFVGYGSGVQISYCDVYQLRHTPVTPPEELDGTDGSSYFDSDRSSYAVIGTRYAGGYAGFLDIGSSASLGGGLKVLDALSLNNALDALSCVISTVEHSDVHGAPGGFAVISSANINASKSLRAAEDELTVYVVDQTNSANFYAYIFNNSTSTNDGTAWPGHPLTCLGKDREGNNYYSFRLDSADYDRVIFNLGSDAGKNSDANCLQLENAQVIDGILPCYNNTSWVVYANGADVWPEAEAQTSCRGSYKHYTSVLGTEEYIETVTDAGASHSFDYQPVAGENKHLHICTECGYVDEEADCTFPAGSYYCSVCGRKNVNTEDNISEGSGLVGRAGGFVGWMRGAHIQDSNSWNFDYIIGQIAAGGYAGEIEPGSVADAVGDTSVLAGLASVSGNLLTVGKEFVPTIRNSVTTCIPCGGAVRANALSDSHTQRGMAGGYVGHNCGGQIWGNNTDAWKDENIADANGDPMYAGPYSECAAIRILSVYGAEYAGGFTGLMDAGSALDSGNISLLYGLVELDNPLSALQITYPTEKNTAVYGPLAQMDYETWNKWIQYVGVYGGYGLGMELVEDQTELDAILENYLYGYHVTAGRETYSYIAKMSSAGCAGGYVGSMHSGTVTNGQAYDCKQVKAMRNAGGFAGEMKPGSAVSLGGGLGMDLGALLSSALDVFVPVVRASSVKGYQSGMSVFAFGDASNHCGNAGGYAGTARGAQIWGQPDETVDDVTVEKGCNVYNLKKVQGSRYVGGYIGNLCSGSAAEVSTEVSEDGSELQDLLDSIVQSGDNGLLSAASAVVSTVRYAKITVADPEWGFTVGGWDETVTENEETTTVHILPLSAGGFVGTMEGAVIGNYNRTVSVTPGQNGEDDEYSLIGENLTQTNIYVNDLRGVEAQYYAGGFVGIANVGGAASIGGSGTSLLSLAQLGEASVLDIFKPYIYNSNVEGVSDGFYIYTRGEQTSGVLCSTRCSGCAGGFAGALLDATVKNTAVTKLNQVQALNYGGGFVGHCGKSGLADVDSANVGSLLGLTAGVGDSFGTNIKSSTVSGVARGYTVTAEGGQEPIAGGFAGFTELAKIGVRQAVLDTEAEAELACSAENLKFVKSEQIAGGFIGKTTKGYLVELQADSPLVEALLYIVNELVKMLYLDDVQNIDLLGLDLGIASLAVATDGDLLRVNLLGINITASLATAEAEGGDTDVAKVTIGDSVIELPCDENGILDQEGSNLTVRLIPLFYTTVRNATVTGIAKGFDVFGGGADQENDGTHRLGYVGGFVGYNHLGEISDSAAVNCDVVRGTPAKLSETATVSVQKVGPFTGCYYDDSTYNANDQTSKETGDSYNGTVHIQETPPDAAFETDAKVKLMDDELLLKNPDTLATETADMQNPCLETVDLTLHKVWDDMNGALGLRAEDPELTLTFQIWQAEVNSDGTLTNATQYETVTLSAADASPYTQNVWTKKITGLPATSHAENSANLPGSSGFKRYAYFVTENIDLGYVITTAYADADVTNKLSFDESKESGYTVRLTNQALLDQTIVLDYGLSVTVDLLEYMAEGLKTTGYELPLTELEVVRLMAQSQRGSVSRTSVEGLSSSVEVTKQNNGEIFDETQPATVYGTFTIPAPEAGAAASAVKYTSASMQFEAPVYVIAALESAEGVYYYTKLTVIPATNIYYESDFLTYRDAAVHSWNLSSASDTEQAVIHPGLDLEDDNQIYGRDAAYLSGDGNSLDDSTVILIDKNDLVVSSGSVQWPTATFTFTGTGFDVLGQTNNESGFMQVYVYQGTETTASNKIATWSVDSYCGMRRSEEKSWYRVACYKSEDEQGNPVWHFTRRPCPEMTEPPTGTEPETGMTVLASLPNLDTYEGGRFVYYEQAYTWTESPNSAESPSLYQVPIISSMDRKVRLPGETEAVSMPYGTYTVVIQPMYSSFFDHNKPNGTANGYYISIDGVRIYEPALELDEEYYAKDHEALPQYLEMRNLLLDQDAYGEENEEVSYCVFFDSIQDPSVADFGTYGPNNEIYLESGQAIAFRLQKSEGAEVDRIHMSVKEVFAPGEGETAAITVSAVPVENGELPEDYAEAELNISSTMECYYDITDAVVWNGNETDFIRIRNTGDEIISLRNLKISFVPAEDEGEEPEEPAGLVTSLPLRAEELQAMLSLLRGYQMMPVVPEDADAFAGASISLESDFSLHFYVPEALLAEAEEAWVVFNKPTAAGELTETCYDSYAALLGELPCRVFRFEHISAAELSTEVTATLFYRVNGEDRMSDPLSYSVRQYAMNMLASTEDAALKTLLVDMLNYGAEAQQYFGVKPEDLANANLTAAQAGFATAAAPELHSDRALAFDPNAAVSFEGCSLSLEKQVAVNYYLSLFGQDPAALELVVSWTGNDGAAQTAVIDGSAFEARRLSGRTLYVAALDVLNAAQMRTVLTASVRRKDTGSVCSDVMRYSIVSYAAGKAAAEDGLAALTAAMIKFGDAAATYFNHNEGAQ